MYFTVVWCLKVVGAVCDREQRLTGTLVFALVGLSALMSSVLKVQREQHAHM